MMHRPSVDFSKIISSPAFGCNTSHSAGPEYVLEWGDIELSSHWFTTEPDLNWHIRFEPKLDAKYWHPSTFLHNSWHSTIFSSGSHLASIISCSSSLIFFRAHLGIISVAPFCDTSSGKSINGKFGKL